MISFDGLLKRGIVFFDGAMGTMLQNRGLPKGARPDVMNIISPDTVRQVHEEYIDAGSDIICTNTFGANRHALSGTGYDTAEIIAGGVSAAKQAANGRTLTALDIGPIGEYFPPLGELTHHTAYELIREQVINANKYGADLIAIETVSDLMELKTAILATKENCKLPILATMTFGKNARTLTGVTPECFAYTAEKTGADAIGINCSLQPRDMLETVRIIANSTHLPIIVKPNAGLPDSQTGTYGLSSEQFAQDMASHIELGAHIIGGCCGTDPSYIKCLHNTFSTTDPKNQNIKHDEYICSSRRILNIKDIVRPHPDRFTISPERVITADSDCLTAVRIPEGADSDYATSLIESVQEQTVNPLYIECFDSSALKAALATVCGVAAVSTTQNFSDIVTHYGCIPTCN